LAIGLCAIAAGGCAGLNHAMEYSDVDVVAFESDGETWRIFDKPNENRLMLTPSIGRALREGVAEGATFGLADPGAPKRQLQGVVESWLAAKHTGKCEVVDGAMIIDPQWEFKYRCS
jgi:hypothetical protein